MSKYSIILPVRNGGAYVKECVRSVLSQEYESYNLIVLDNCSTDGTWEWINSLNNDRIIMYRADRPLSIEENWARIVSVPKNEFITLIGHDDVLFKNYLSVMDGLISSYPDASLYMTRFRYINANGGTIRKCRPMLETLNAAQFLEGILKGETDIMGTGFLMRARDYDAIGGIPMYPNLLFADFELWVALTRLSYLACAPLECFAFRLHHSTTSISPDTKFHKAFEQFIRFLNHLRRDDPGLGTVVSHHAVSFVSKYCKGLSHRLLRTPMKARDQLNVNEFAQRCKAYADLLAPENCYNPLADPSVRLAQIMDNTAVGRKLFLIFKKLYPKPLLK